MQRAGKGQIIRSTEQAMEEPPDANREFALQQDGQQTPGAGIKREAISFESVSIALDQADFFRRAASSWRKSALVVVEKFLNNLLVARNIET